MLINLNADLGESFGPWSMGDDPALLEIVNSANVACGFHAGDPLVMLRTVELARERGVSIGAHPGFPDLQGFGRRPMTLPPAELEAVLLYQMAALSGVAAAAGHRMTHVKVHGALSNMACADRTLSEVISRSIKRFDPSLILLAPALSPLAAAGVDDGLTVALEVFADRTYQEDGQLTPRKLPGSVLHHPEECVAHVLKLVEAGGIVTTSGAVLPCVFHSICLHGDGPEAVASARAIRAALLERGHTLVALPDLFGG